MTKFLALGFALALAACGGGAKESSTGNTMPQGQNMGQAGQPSSTPPPGESSGGMSNPQGSQPQQQMPPQQP
jgi:hypothetical protein